MRKNQPIGVFDSGLGGLTVLRELLRRFPGENFVYLGDVARLPYGTKSPTVIQRYSRRCVEYLLGEDVKAVVVACNSATASSLDYLRESFELPLFGVIEAGVHAAARVTRSGKVLVLATATTVRSEAYPRKFATLYPDIQVKQLACPLLVPLAEEGWFDHPVTQQTIREYLEYPAEGREFLFGIDTVVLGCTHYPLLAPSFEKVLPQTVKLVHGAGELSEQLQAALGILPDASVSSGRGSVRFLSTDVVSTKLRIVGELFESARFETVDL